MLTVGEQFPAFTLQGINENNEFVEVKVEENYQPTKHDWSVVYFYPKDLGHKFSTHEEGQQVGPQLTFLDSVDLTK